RTEADVDRTAWRHGLIIVKPNDLRSDKALLLIGGGSNRDEAPREADGKIVALALGSGSVVAELRCVPNQPLVFCGDGEPRHEDDLIGYTWDKFLTTGEATWLARLPMVKSAVRAMDTIEALLASPAGGGLRIRGFVVAGASKRGWTTWLTGAVDRRVIAIIPIVIDVLSTRESIKHHWAAYGFWSSVLADYVHHKIMPRMDTPECTALMEIEDPLVYRDRLVLPKYIVNASGDQFFLPDSSQFYFDDLPGEKYLRYVPNTDHSLKDSDAVESILAYYRAVIRGVPRPEFSWSFEPDGSIRVAAKDAPRDVHLWQATNPKARDFRLETIGPAFRRSDLADRGDGTYVAKVPTPAKGWTAFYVEMVYASGGPESMKFTTAVRVVPDVLPYEQVPIGNRLQPE
ncbi:MAG: PhoPQ-activated pathogenicity, partial [Planctomycetes bacterium RBG_13_63_9]